MDKDLLELVDVLIKRTGSPSVMWEDASTLSGGERFRLNFGDVVVEISDGEATRWREEDESQVYPMYRLQIINSRGFIVAEQELAECDHLYGKLAALFDSARSNSRRRGEVISGLINRIGR